jgi:hypothetical protein
MTHSRPLANHGHPSRDDSAEALTSGAVNDSFMTFGQPVGRVTSLAVTRRFSSYPSVPPT